MAISINTTGFDTDRLALIDAFLKERYLDTGRLANAQLLISREGAIAHFSSQGPAREGGAALRDDALFRIASMTKPVTSIAFMMLVEEGKVALDTPVAKVLPELAGLAVYNGGGGGVAFQTKPLARPLLMVDLLRHTSGFTYGFQNRGNVDAAYRDGKIENWHDNLTLDEFVAALGKIPLEFSPGESWNYSVSTDVLGAVVQRLSGVPLDEFLATRIFAPLKMDDTFFTVPADKIDRLTDCYSMVPGKGRVLTDRGADSAWSRPPRLVSGGGGLVSTALDYNRFCQMLLNGGSYDGARIVGRKTIDLMTQNHLPDGGDLASWSKSMFSEASNAGVGFGLGFAVTQNVAKLMIPGSVGEYYWGGLYSTAFFVDPAERMTMVFMTQLAPSSTWPVRRELRTLIYSALA
ncbi:CubicO group peptidase (beta-lactamase class C family) [Novosphingobium kunmingense]|uniref:CubicO group peptidase (Beta-lactamase class C family) n=1 Tax=Novosphingobium kunmingense TaxID=1211806 RepID=A0A2N0I1Y8_9SPHN|nr:serine hydrolase domain-containing protein [Novosphingobium kunmingense]PKB25209.1 CubicO group peptidase (beta-lactamase class C family) [Novosphingobium kunmingense]